MLEWLRRASRAWVVRPVPDVPLPLPERVNFSLAWGDRLRADSYGDVIETGSLAARLATALRERGSDLVAQAVPPGDSVPATATVTAGDRGCQVNAAAETRMFLAAFWSRGACLASAADPDVDRIADAVVYWLAETPTAARFASRYPFVRADPEAELFESGSIVEHRWQQLLAGRHGFPDLQGYIVAAAEEPRLRQLYPYTSMMWLRLSRCTCYPYEPVGAAVQGWGGRYWLFGADESNALPMTAEDAVQAVVALLPDDCGPARMGSADRRNHDHATTTPL